MRMTGPDSARFEWGTQYGPFGGFLRRRGPSPVRCPRPRMVARSGFSRESVMAGPRWRRDHPAGHDENVVNAAKAPSAPGAAR